MKRSSLQLKLAQRKKFQKFENLRLTENRRYNTGHSLGQVMLVVVELGVDDSRHFFLVFIATLGLI